MSCPSSSFYPEVRSINMELINRFVRDCSLENPIHFMPSRRNASEDTTVYEVFMS